MEARRATVTLHFEVLDISSDGPPCFLNTIASAHGEMIPWLWDRGRRHGGIIDKPQQKHEQENGGKWKTLNMQVWVDSPDVSLAIFREDSC